MVVIAHELKKVIEGLG